MTDRKVLIAGAIAAVLVAVGYFIWGTEEAAPPAAPTTTTAPAKAP